MAAAARRPATQGRRAPTAAYRVSPGLVVPLAAGMFAVHTPVGAFTRVFYCEPTTGRCSCGAPTGPCPHVTAALAVADAARPWPDARVA
jgi:hypothetical protein